MSMKNDETIDRDAFKNGFKARAKSPVNSSTQEPPSNALDSSDDKKFDRAHSITEDSSSRIRNSYDPSKNLMPDYSKEERTLQRTYSMVSAPRGTNSRDFTSSLTKSIGKNNIASLLDIDNSNKEEIFQRLCPPNKYKDSESCLVCKAKFNILLKKRRNCKFCGESICDDHGKKRRPDPETPGSYVRICDICDKKYINKIIQDEFKAKLDKIEQEVQLYEQQLAKTQEILRKKQQTYDNQISEKNRKDKEYNDTITNLIQKITETRDDIKRIDKENTKLNEKYTQLQKENEELEKKINELTQQDLQQEKESGELSLKIQAIDQDIAHISKMLQEYDRNMAINKMTKGDDGKNRETSYLTKADVIDVAKESLLSQGWSDVPANSKGDTSHIKHVGKSHRKVVKNQKADTGMCSTGCTIF